MYSTVAFGKTSQEGKFEKITIERGETGPNDVEFDIKYCGICHTDVHYAGNDMGDTKWPLVPGHELAGVVTKVGSNVKNFVVGDHVGVGCIVDSCMDCGGCNAGEEQYCEKGMTMTYNADIKHGNIKTKTGYTLGGYSGKISVHNRYAIKIPKSYPLECAGPIFCAGITMYSPLKHWCCGNGGKRVGIVGVGGLGQMGIRLAAAMGNEVTAISTSAHKEDMAKKAGAKNFVVSTDEDAMAKAAKSLDVILNTVAANHQVMHYYPLLATNGTIVQLGLVLEPHVVPQFPLMLNRTSVAGSLIGGLPQTQELIDYCAEKNIRPQIEVIKADKIDEVFQKLSEKNDSITRYVLDIEGSK